ncbi:Cuticular-like protein [Daphnia magna]|uniref:Cuticular-like protein n=1 Tax=Daphnia magna TaxID=35525 RepID=A0A164K0F9_9CRUS|nr:Cuticular-like protein [Daphnia magna]
MPMNLTTWQKRLKTSSYCVQLPDGRTQIFTYTADSYGYTADVKFEGKAKYAEYVHPKHNTSSAPAYQATTAPVYSVSSLERAPVPVSSAPQHRASLHQSYYLPCSSLHIPSSTYTIPIALSKY